MQTLLLDVQRWDLVTDSDGNIAAASDPYSTAQDVASAVLTFLSEVFYNTTLGLPYLNQNPAGTQILGQGLNVAFLKAQIAKAALTVPGVTNPTVFISSFSNRAVSGQVQFTDANGASQTAGF